MTIKESMRIELQRINDWLKFKYEKIPEISKQLTEYIQTLDLMLFEEPEAVKTYTQNEVKGEVE